ncbi:MAG TPA: urease subunit alpha [Candidatus Dormibacteraeota bacterium]|nr:urease subunit alpha [Candidatus Dormibacteraeota bacterium]
MNRLLPEEHRARFGPSAGDRIRLGDTDMWIRVDEDRQALGDEPIWGYAKDLRLGMAQAQSAGPSELDAVVVGAVIVDPLLGVIKADIGIKDGRVAGIGRAGNPAITDGIDLRIGPHTRPISGYGLIATAGAVDSHVHFVSPNLIPAALAGGVTTLISAGFTEPPARMERILRGLEGYPVNVGLQANARSTEHASLEVLLDAGAIGFKVHEDYGASPELIDATLRFADARDVSVSLHTDGLHETAELEDTIAAIAGRTVHAYHVEGSGGGHVPDLIGIVREANVICSSTTPTIPWGVSAVDEGVPMTVLNHGAAFGVAEDLALIRERTHPATMAAEGPLHELGAIQIVNSDSQGMGRIMETLRRTIQLADAMKAWRATDAGRGHPGLPDDGWAPSATGSADDNARVLRYLAKVTIEPAITHGVAAHVGSLDAGHLADIVLWKPAYFGVKPELVIKGGFAAWSPLGEGNATVQGAEPTRYGPDWAGRSHGAASVSALFVSGSADHGALRHRLGTGRELLTIAGCRGLTRAALALNRATAPIDVDPVDGRVTLAGRPLAAAPVAEVPLSRRYLFR